MLVKPRTKCTCPSWLMYLSLLVLLVFPFLSTFSGVKTNGWLQLLFAANPRLTQGNYGLKQLIGATYTPSFLR